MCLVLSSYQVAFVALYSHSAVDKGTNGALVILGVKKCIQLCLVWQAPQDCYTQAFMQDNVLASQTLCGCHMHVNHRHTSQSSCALLSNPFSNQNTQYILLLETFFVHFVTIQ